MSAHDFRLTNEQISETPSVEFKGRTYFDTARYPFFPLGPCLAKHLPHDLDAYGFMIRKHKQQSAFQSPAEFAHFLECVEKGQASLEGRIVSFEGFGHGIYPLGLGFEAGFTGADALQSAIEAATEWITLAALGFRETKMNFFTFGGARYKTIKGLEAPAPVRNRLPPPLTETRLPSVAECVSQIERMYIALKGMRPDKPAAMILAISPERTLFDEAECGQNPFLADAISKSVVRAAICECMDRHQDWDIAYFPADEIVSYELRQFETLCHTDHCQIDPTHTPRYLCKRFVEAYASPQMIETMRLIDQIGVLNSRIGELKGGNVSPLNKVILNEANRLLEENERIGKTFNVAISANLFDLIENLEDLAGNVPAGSESAFKELLQRIARQILANDRKIELHQQKLEALAGSG